MKRPEGFDRPRTAAPPPEPTTTALRRRRRGADRHGAQPAEAETAKPKSAKPETAKLQPAEPQPAEPQPAERQRRRERPGRRVARAARERRRFERNEIRRFTRRSRHRRLAWLVAGSIVLVLGGLIAVAVYSPLLALRTIEVEGTSRVQAAEVHAAVDGQLGTPLALVDYGKITRALAGIPLIRSFVTETVPPHTLVVHIVERTPVGTLATATGFDVVDPAGVVIQSAPTRPPGLPLIDVGGAGADRPAFRAAVAVLLALPQSVLARVDSVTAQTKDDVTLVLAGAGQRVVWGSADRAELKARVLQELIATQDPAHRVEYDVTAPLSPVIRPVG